MTFDGAEDDEISKDAKQAVKELLSDYDTYISTSVGSEEEQTESLNNDMNLILVLAVVIIVVVLLISTKAYMEIPVLLITFGVAALLNKGTNYLMGTISSVTDSISVVLQLALAIDYAIIFVIVLWKSMRRWMRNLRLRLRCQRQYRRSVLLP